MASADFPDPVGPAITIISGKFLQEIDATIRVIQ
jgi:hypothetical protein